MFSALSDASPILSLLRSLASVVSCVENNTSLASIHNSFWAKQVSGLMCTPLLAQCGGRCLQAESQHFHHLSHTSTNTCSSTCICTQIEMTASVHAHGAHICSARIHDISTKQYIYPFGTGPDFSGNKGHSNR